MALVRLPGPVGDFVSTTTYQTGDIVRDNTLNVSWMSLVDNNTNALPTTRVTDANWQLLTQDGMGGGGTPVTPQEHFTFSIDPTSGVQSPNASTTFVTATMGVTGTGFTYTGYTNARVIGASGDLSVSAVSGTGNTFSASVSRVLTGSYRFTADIRSTDNNGTALPNHSVSTTFNIGPAFYVVNDTSTMPTTLAGLTAIGWSGSDTRPITKTADSSSDPAVPNNVYYILPTRTAGYTFKSGIVFLSSTNVGTIGDHTVYRITDFDTLTAGQTLTVETTET